MFKITFKKLQRVDCNSFTNSSVKNKNREKRENWEKWGNCMKIFLFLFFSCFQMLLQPNYKHREFQKIT